ncbi:MAG TPA: peptidase inhibitor family I36 protein [Dactylosporangium sp.]|nr:peptidase inhibitor family I36 protein [Dactylosporangium sp.]
MSGLTVAVIGLLTAAIGLVSSPVWAPHACRAIGVCSGSGPDNDANAGGTNKGSSNGGSSNGGNSNGGNSNGGKDAGGAGWTCPGGQFCAWDGRDGGGAMIVQRDSTCSLYDIGSAGLGDRVRSYQNRTGKTVGLYNWSGQKWDLLVRVTDGAKGNLPASADRQTDAVKICE